MEQYLERIQAIFSEPIDSYRIIQDGWTNVVVEVNAQWIFRFVRNMENRQIAVERDFLPKFEQVSPVAVPSLMMSDDDFIAYRKIEGERLSTEKFSLLSTAQQKEVTKSIGMFLTCLHAFEFDHPYLSAAPFGGGDFWNELWPLVGHRLSDETRRKAEYYFTSALEKISAKSFKKSITHSDLGGTHTLVNFDEGRLAGIIDFGDLSLRDPAVDFSSYYRHFGHQFVEEILQEYRRPIEDNFWERIEFEAKRKLFFVTYFALHNGFESEVPRFLSAIETLFLDESCNPV